MRDSSVLCILHFSTPKSVLRGKDFSWFFRPIRDSLVNSFFINMRMSLKNKWNNASHTGKTKDFWRSLRVQCSFLKISDCRQFSLQNICRDLDMLCCLTHTCSWAPFLSLLLMSMEMRPFFSSATFKVIMPRTSMFCSPPSRPQVREIFSSTLRCTLANRVDKLLPIVIIEK